MESRSYLNLVYVILIGFVASTEAYDYYVGGKDGWVLKPSESYSQWSARNRFIVNDKLVFKGSDSVLVVNKEDFDTCNVSNPVLKLEGGDSNFQVDKPGPFYFISGNQSNCQNGQKLSLVVISPRTKSATPTAAPSSPIGSTPPSPQVTAPSSPPISSPPSPPTSAPVTSSPSPPTSGPSSAPSGSNLVAPSGFPFSGPPSAPGMAPTGSRFTGPSSGPGSSNPSGANAPGRGPNSSSPISTTSSAFALGCSLLVAMALLCFAPSF